MKNVQGYWVPDREDRLKELLDESAARGKPSYQHHKLAAALALTSKRRVAIDVGSHIGMWTMQLLAAGFDHVNAFDPDPEKGDCFIRNLREHAPTLAGPAKSDGFKKVTRFPVGLGAQAMQVDLVHKTGTSLKTHVKPTDAGQFQIVPLDSYGFVSVDFIKIDVEGFEKYVVEGAQQTIRNNKPVIVIEQKKGVAAKRYGIGDQDALRMLEAWGYVVNQEFNGDFIMVPSTLPFEDLTA